jgi:hypothetical protein
MIMRYNFFVCILFVLLLSTFTTALTKKETIDLDKLTPEEIGELSSEQKDSLTVEQLELDLAETLAQKFQITEEDPRYAWLVHPAKERYLKIMKVAKDTRGKPWCETHECGRCVLLTETCKKPEEQRQLLAAK